MWLATNNLLRTALVAADSRIGPRRMTDEPPEEDGRQSGNTLRTPEPAWRYADRPIAGGGPVRMPLDRSRAERIRLLRQRVSEADETIVRREALGKVQRGGRAIGGSTSPR